jgi:6-phosphogluconolactonase (cycloisomerase 2 family)
VTNAAVTSVNVTCVTQVGRFVYVANAGSNNISAYSINASTGALTAVPGSPFPADQAPASVSANGAGTLLYVSNQGSSTVPPRLSGYSINGTSGALTQLANSPFDLSNPPPPGPARGISKPMIHSSGGFIYVNIEIPLYADQLYGATVDSTGDLTVIPGMPITVGVGATLGMFNAAGNVLYLANGGSSGIVSAYSVSVPSGVLSPIGSYATGGQIPVGSTLNATGTLLFTPNLNSGTVSVFKVDSTTGALTLAMGSPVSTGTATQPSGVAVHPTKDFVYVVNTVTNFSLSSVAGFQLDTATGTLTPLAGSPYTTHGYTAVVPAVDPSGRFLFVVNTSSNNIQAFVIDPATGVLTDVPGTPFASGGNSPSQAWIDRSGKYLFSSDLGSNTVSAYAINDTTGAVTLINTVPAGTSPGFPEVVGVQ